MQEIYGWWEEPNAVKPPLLYSYAYGTQEYVGLASPQPNQVRVGDWLRPANVTDVKPPETKEHETAIWDGSSWSVKPDYRGEFWFKPNGEMTRIETFINPIELGYSKEPPVLELPEVKVELSRVKFDNFLENFGYSLQTLDQSLCDENDPIYTSDEKERTAYLNEIKRKLIFTRDDWLVTKLIQTGEYAKEQIYELWKLSA